MAYVKLATLSMFLLATFVMFPMKNVEASSFSLRGIESASCYYLPCTPLTFLSTCFSGCSCIPPIPAGLCISDTYKHAVKMVGADAKLCQSDDECKTKGMGSYCALRINPNGDYGWCFDSESEAEILLAPKSEASKSTYAEDFLRMPLPLAA